MSGNVRDMGSTTLATATDTYCRDTTSTTAGEAMAKVLDALGVPHDMEQPDLICAIGRTFIPVASNGARVDDRHTSTAAAQRTKTKDVARFSQKSQSGRLLGEFFYATARTAFGATMNVIGPPGQDGVSIGSFEGCRRRVSDLVAAKYIADSGGTEQNDGGDEAILWEITPLGKRAFEKMTNTGWTKPKVVTS